MKITLLTQLRVLRRHLNDVLDDPILTSDWGRKSFEKDFTELYGEDRGQLVKLSCALSKYETKQREGDKRLLKAIFGVENIKDVKFKIESVEEDEIPEDDEIDDEDIEDDPYAERLANEYWDLHKKIEKLKEFLKMYDNAPKGILKPLPSQKVMEEQLKHMTNYLETLEKRAVVENIELGKYKENK